MNITLGDRTAETAAVYFEKTRSPVIRSTLPQKARTLEEALADFRETQLPGAKSFGRTIYADGQYVGDVWCCCMDPAGDPQAMVSYCVFEQELWGRGVAAKALGLFLAEIRERFRLERVGAFTFAANTGSIRVLEKNGFRLQESFTEDGVESGYYVRISSNGD
ncbi:MAG: GNAT family N-acetyltransferase [Oscillibacter sp.]|nr:GNAT family N-acetyltransferase [Oscillibacter sp.]